MQPLQNLRTCKAVMKLGAEKLEWAHRWNKIGKKNILTKGFDSLEKILEKTAGKFCVGDEITLADTFLMPQYRNAVQRFKLNHEDYPVIHKVYRNLCENEQIRNAFPENQDDCPEHVKEELLAFKL